ncbi:MAG TPA: hypothetical protein VMS45_09630, partial [Gemmatimonadaceae bacterium]|nr:hypothetical protein [Gemmatimonadaceae bacterium]
ELLREQRAATNAVEGDQLRIVPEVFHRMGMPIRDCYHAWRMACRKAGVPGRLMHDFRRTAVRRLELARVPRSVAMKLVGHETQAIYDRYAITSPGDLTAGVRRVAEYLRNDTSEERTSTHPPSKSESAEVSLTGQARN